MASKKFKAPRTRRALRRKRCQDRKRIRIALAKPARKRRR